VSTDLEPLEKLSKADRIKEGDTFFIPVTIPAGVSQAEFQLDWLLGWENYPTNDLDLILVDPNGVPNFAGATINSPERVSVANPAAGVWTIVVDGFQVNTRSDTFKLRVNLDGKTVKIK